jgi:ADP-ribosyl-[dinitrogen reductase] hydrolase
LRSPGKDYTIVSAMTEEERILGGLWGAVVGDALGVPVEFRSREERRRDPVTQIQGHGTFNQPPGTWSDDSSLILCTVESLLGGFNTADVAEGFRKWYNEAHWTPHGKVFDVGLSTKSAITRMNRGIEPELAGDSDERSNGNGSLMRIIPAALYFAHSPAGDLLRNVHRLSSLTHRHVRSHMACGFYCLIAVALLSGADCTQAYRSGVDKFLTNYNKPPYLKELPHFGRVFSGSISELSGRDIRSSGYVVDTLEAGVWSLLTTSSFSDAVLRAVNLGGDTDTTGCVTGGLAGIHYGLQAIPEGWLRQLARRDDLEKLFTLFAASVPARREERL